MTWEVVLVAVSCVLFINMGLSEAIQDIFRLNIRIISCVKCCTFWFSLAFLLINGAGLFASVAASFLLSYAALWLDLGLSYLNTIYNRLYEQINSTEDAKPEATEADGAESDEADMPEV